MELLAVRSRLALARQGRDLLEQKRDALMHEFYREVRTVYAAHDELDAAAGAARHALEEARVLRARDARIVEHNVESAELPDRRGHQVLHVLQLPDVSRDANYPGDATIWPTSRVHGENM